MLAYHDAAFILADVIICKKFLPMPQSWCTTASARLGMATQVVTANADATTSTKLKIGIFHAFMEGIQ